MKNYDYALAELIIRDAKINCLIFENRNNMLKDDLIHAGYKVLYIRHSDEDWGEPVTIENFVCVNFYAYLAIKQPSSIELIESMIPQGDQKAYINLDGEEIFLNIIEDVRQEVLPESE